jgi:hypothetical protein
MPPWKPAPGYGKFQHERRLTDERIAPIAVLGQSRRARRQP